MPEPYSKPKQIPLNPQSSYLCVICSSITSYDKFARRSKSGNQPPICNLCRSKRSKEVDEVLAISGYKGMKQQSAARMRANPTPAEKAMRELLKSAKVRFKEQAQLLGFIADFDLRKRMIIIEVDGGYHTEQDQTDYDRGRDVIFNRYGYRVIRISNEEVLSNPTGCLDRIKETIGLPRIEKPKKKIRSARQRVIEIGRASKI